MKHGTVTLPEEVIHALLNPPHDPNKKRPPLGWEDEDSTHDHWMKAADVAIAARKAAGLL